MRALFPTSAEDQIVTDVYTDFLNISKPMDIDAAKRCKPRMCSDAMLADRLQGGALSQFYYSDGVGIDPYFRGIAFSAAAALEDITVR